MFFKILIILLASIYIVDGHFGKKLVNLYECWGLFGKPGCGKTTLLNKFAYQHQKKGWTVYTDFGTTIPGIQQFADDDFKSGKWLPDGRKGKLNEYGDINESDRDILIVIDEIGTLYNNRDYKTNFTNPSVLKWWKEHRHRRCKIIYASQIYNDMDKKIRPLTDKYMIVKRSPLKCISYAKPILTSIDITNSESSDNAGGQIIDIYKYAPFTSWIYTLLPRWIHKFDSFA